MQVFLSASNCRTNTCSCTKAHIPCSAFCNCSNDESCQNPMKIFVNEDEEDDCVAGEEED